MKYCENKSEGKELVLAMTASDFVCFCVLLPQAVKSLRDSVFLQVVKCSSLRWLSINKPLK